MSINTKRISSKRELEHVRHLRFSFLVLGPFIVISIFDITVLSMVAAPGSIVALILLVVVAVSLAFFIVLKTYFVIYGFYKWWKGESIKTKLISRLKKVVIYIGWIPIAIVLIPLLYRYYFF